MTLFIVPIVAKHTNNLGANMTTTAEAQLDRINQEIQRIRLQRDGYREAFETLKEMVIADIPNSQIVATLATLFPEPGAALGLEYE